MSKRIEPSWSEYEPANGFVPMHGNGEYSVVTRDHGVRTAYWCETHQKFRIELTTDDEVLAFGERKLSADNRWMCPKCCDEDDSSVVLRKEYYRYEHSTSGCDREFVIFCPGSERPMCSIPFWDAEVEAEALARRIVAALNACEGVSTEELEQNTK